MTQSPERLSEEGPVPATAEDAKADNLDNTQVAHKGPRKRTKTGCLTCRKRRIKCGEEKPICSNCTKSKRYCEGYNNPRIVFRQPSSGFGHPDDAFHARPPLSSHFESFEGYNPALHHLNGGVSNQSLRTLRPIPQQVHQQNYYAARDPFYVPSGGQCSPTTAGDGFLAGAPYISLSADGNGTFGSSSNYLLRHPSISGHDSGSQPWASALSAEQLQDRPHLRRWSTLASSHPLSSASNPRILPGTFPSMGLPTPQSASQFSSLTDDTPALTPTQIAALSDQPLPSGHPFYSEARGHVHDSSLGTVSTGHDAKRYTAQGFVQRPSFNTSIPFIASPPPVSALQVSHEEEEDEDDPFDVEIETDEANIHPSEQSRKDLNNMLSRHVAHDAHRGVRSFTTFLNQKNVLASYRPSHAALPQADEKAARIFCHFVSSTGPSMTIYERFSTPQVNEAGSTAISSFQQPLWTYTLPSLALHHPPLMHAMLALSALHISKLQQTSPGPSIKHFTYALRRVGRLIGLPKRRNEPTTLAANLLLGFYEVMSAETSKWNIHLSGARVLVMEIDFAGKTRKIRALRAQAKNQLAQLSLEHHSDYMRYSGIPESLFPDRDWDVDEDLISTFTGFHVRYDFQYQTNVSQPTHQNLEFTSKDVELYKMQSDLYWWYCKQDIFQSMLSGNRLLMRYDHWAYCPPRGQIGQLDQIYATMDHLCLIMARLADFGGKDQGRKRRVVAAQSSQAPQSAMQTHPPQGGPPPGQGPPMGYMPENPVSMPSAFVAMSQSLYQSGFPQQPLAATSEAEDLEAETAAAHAEHAAIAKAFDIFAECLPEEFDPLPTDAAPPISTPFGPALQYRTHTIACIWTLYYSGCILLRRLHPAMPPAAMISAQAGAAQTAPFAQKIGKVCAGLYYPQQYNLQIGALNPSLGGALIESTFALFFAAVQFTDHAQRGWTINKLKEIARLSGWQTAAAVAAGCEFAWEATGKAGRGPPYRPTMNWRSKDDRVGDKVLKNADKMAKAAQKAREKEERAKEKEQQRSQEEDEVRESERRQREREEQYFIAAGKDGPRRKKTSTIKKIRRRRVVPRTRNEGQENNDAGDEFEEYEEEVEVEEDDEDAEPEAITHDRKTIGTNPFARTHWALGLLSLDEDIAKIDLVKQ